MPISLTSVSAAAFVFGAVVGSFLNVVAYRVVRGESIVHPRSHCTTCATTLSPVELVPLLSWLFLRGRCRTCGAVIPMRYAVIELCTATLFALTTVTVPFGLKWLAWGVFWALLTTVVATDLTAMRVPNVLSLGGAVVVTALVGLSGIHPWWSGLLGALEAAGVLLLLQLVSRGGMGMGDVKLYLSVGAMLGFLPGLESLIVASLFGSVVGLSMRAVGWLRAREHVPFVPYIAIGVVVVVFFGHTMSSWYLSHVL
ncbi:prepilin peptidase [Alicyclobacillus sp. ALC3]|uniref:prepilin peptidase n=1 Tax=Alicyclobacillus sp. ALC3 TaxID=2796143 RepID=UPI0023798D3B|nr:A24 family peptidase [Alicyclobacillus sp. ALC3]WDL96987.1 prepilin peptidase [Alicyclobacillus sp. ALC3]